MASTGEGAVSLSAGMSQPDIGAPLQRASTGKVVAASTIGTVIEWYDFFVPVDRGEILVVLHYPTAEAACRAFMAGGGGARAIQHSGEERVRRAIVQALEGFRTETGDYRIENRFQLVIAEPAAS
jgi:hypothetical protein